MSTLIVGAVAFVASVLTLFSGFGLGTLLMPVVAIFMPIAAAVAVTAVVHLLNNLFKLVTLWRDIHWRTVWTFGVPAMLATVPGAWLLTHLASLPGTYRYHVLGLAAEMTPIGVLVGGLLMAFAVIEWFSLAKRWQVSARHLPLGGLLSGFFGGLSGHQGAFRSAFLLHAGLDAPQFVASNAALAALVDITRLVVYGLNLALIVSGDHGQIVVVATLAAFAGVLLGKVLLKKVTIAAIQRLVAVMLLVLGALLMAGVL